MYKYIYNRLVPTTKNQRETSQEIVGEMCPFTAFFKTDVGRKIPFHLRSLVRKSRASESSNNGVWLFPYQKPLSTTKAPIKGSSLIIRFGHKRAFLSRRNTSRTIHMHNIQFMRIYVVQYEIIIISRNCSLSVSVYTKSTSWWTFGLKLRP